MTELRCYFLISMNAENQRRFADNLLVGGEIISEEDVIRKYMEKKNLSREEALSALPPEKMEKILLKHLHRCAFYEKNIIIDMDLTSFKKRQVLLKAIKEYPVYEKIYTVIDMYEWPNGGYFPRHSEAFDRIQTY